MNRKYQILILLLLISKLIFGQDTIITKERYLIGSSVLTGSNRNSESCMLHGYCFDKIIKHSCISVMTEIPEKTEIKNVEMKQDTLKISLKVYENCAFDFLGEIEITDKHLLNIILHEYGSFASCMCTFDIDCIIVIQKEDIPEPFEVDYVILNNQEYTKTKIKK